ncbi:PfkB family carbohydrate kinase [Shimia thalassica]|uniref:PfkB family carbohydrate kinase n=1 Tax=Shimia thalassica TaxID=1715693 RepID=UPI002734CB8B|nr:PfkB family carbohydrate kinase [Shimia thalassica]MDP2496009.1 PfkB family carbohydrate kinase [Shimia thalassica]
MTSTRPHALDILCFGEPMFEFSWIEKDNIRPGIGGDVSNTAVAATRAGAKAGMLTHLGTDGFGDHILQLYSDEGIDASRVQRSEAAPTGLYFIEYGPNGHQFSYRRAGSAASQIGPDDLDQRMFDDVGVLHISGITQAISETACAASIRAAELARKAGARVAFDTNLRLNLWTAQQAVAAMEQILPLVDVVFPSIEDSVALFGLSDPEEICKRFLSFGVEMVVLTLAKKGAIVATEHGQHMIDAFPANLTDATGAGDTFDGAFLAEFSRSKNALDAARFACAAASLSVETVGAVASIPHYDAIQSRMQKGEIL